MTSLSRLVKLGLAPEVTYGTYLAPTVSVPFTTANVEDIRPPYKDESVRANDNVLQALVPGTQHATLDLAVNGYPDLIGNWFKAMGLFDTVSGGVSTTLASSCTANATSISLTATVPNNSILKLDTGALLEYVKVGTVTGSGPYTAPITVGGGTGNNSTTFAHASSSAVVSQYTHTFKQNRTFATVWPSYSFTTDDGVTGDQIGWPGCVASELALKIDPKALITSSPKFVGLASAAQTTFTPAFTGAQPMIGWQWTVTDAGGTSTRGLTCDITLKRNTGPIFSSTGSQSPREIFPGALEVDATYKAIFDSVADLNLYIQGIQEATTMTVTQPVIFGGTSLQITNSLAGWTSGKRDFGQEYVQADFAYSGIANSTDGSPGAISCILMNYQTTGY